jgi:hypothetical protein
MNYEYILGVLSLLLTILVTATVFTMRRVIAILRRQEIE